MKGTMLVNILSLLLILFSNVLTFAQFINLDSQINKFREFKNLHSNAELNWNVKTGVAASLFKMKVKLKDQDIKQGIKRFLNDNKDMLGINKIVNDLEITDVSKLTGIQQVVIKQFYKKIRVDNSQYHFYLDSENNIVMLNGNLYPEIKLDVKEIYTETEALQVAKGFIADNKYELKDYKLLGKVILQENDISYLAWKFFLSYHPFDAYYIYVDAHKNNIIKTVSTYMRSTGYANIYLSNPPNGLSNDITLYNLDGSFYLRGDYVISVNGFDDNETHGIRNDFRFDPSVDEFDEANAYYHIDRIASEYFQALNVNPPSVFVNLIDDTLGGAHAADIGELQLGRGNPNSSNPTNKPTRSNDVIYHEYSHAVIHSLGLGSDWGETRAKNEGYADYFTACYTGDPEIFEWYFINYDHGTNVSNNPSTFHYNNWNTVSYNFMQPGQPHVQGMIWSGALWDLRQILGPSITDDLVIKGLLFSQGNTNYEEGKNGIIQSDNFYYGGIHEQIILNIFQSRGIGNPSVPPNFIVLGSVGEHPSLYWQSPGAPDIVGYKVYQSVNQGAYNLYATLGSTATSYVDNGTIITDGQFDPVICYAVSAFDIYNQESNLSVSDCIKSDLLSKPESEVVTVQKDVQTIAFDPYPNPFNSETNIRIQLAESSSVALKVFNILGELVVAEKYSLPEGVSNIRISNKNLVSGVYYYSISINNHINSVGKTGKFVYTK